MEQAITGIFSVTFVVFALVVALAVITIRTILETLFKKLRFIIPDKWEGYIIDLWREWMLRVLPVVIGGVLGLVFTAYPYPDAFGEGASGRVFFGLIAGLFSSTIYSFTKFHVKKYLPEELKSKLERMNPMFVEEEEEK